MGAWLGLAYGLLEGLESTFLALVPGALAWRTGNSPQVLWFAPLFYALAFLVPAALLAGLARAFRRPPWDLLLVFLLAGAGTYLAAILQGQVFSEVASLVLGLGVGVQAARLYRARRESWSAGMARTLPHLAAVVLLLALLMLVTGRGAEALALRRLPAAGEERPNVLLLVLDTLRQDHLSAYGYRRPTTPRLERLAAEGALFENAYASSSWTLPSHASLFTARSVHEHGAGNVSLPFLDGRFPTLAEVLRDAGYATGGFVANAFWCGRQTGLHRGFLRYEDFYGELGDAAARTVLGRRLAYEVLPRFGLVDIPGRKRADEVNRDLLAWLNQIGDRPFFAFLNYMDVHGPYLPPTPYDGRFSGRPRAGHETKAIELGVVTPEVTVPPPEIVRRWVDGYDESLVFLDTEIGRLLDELARRRILDRTVVIVTSDHGESWGEHDLIGHGNSLYLEQVRVPLLVRFPPRIRAGSREPRPVSLTQLPATALELLAIGGPSFPGTPLFGSAPAVGTGPPLAEVSRRPLVPPSWPTARGWLKSVLTDRWQLILLESGEVELYDVRSDPRELRNLAGTPAMAGVLTELRSSLAPALGDGPSPKPVIVREFLRRLRSAFTRSG